MQGLTSLFKRELYAFLISPTAAIFTIAFLLTSTAFTIYIGQFFERDQADMLSFFRFVPWLCIIFAPALAMRTWSEELRIGTLELLHSLPITPWALIMAKFLSLWLVGVFSIALSFPIWLVISYLGEPDHMMVMSGYVGSFLLMGGYLAITQALSIFTRNQILALVPGIAICFIMTVPGAQVFMGYVQPFLSNSMMDMIAGLSFLLHYENFTRGVIDLRSVLYFLIFIASCLVITRMGLERQSTGG